MSLFCVLQDALQHHSGTVFPPHVPQQETTRYEQTQFWVFLPAAGNARSGCRSRGRGGGGAQPRGTKGGCGPGRPSPAPRTLYWSRCRRPLTCKSLAVPSLKLQSHSRQWNRITLPSWLHTCDTELS